MFFFILRDITVVTFDQELFVRLLASTNRHRGGILEYKSIIIVII